MAKPKLLIADASYDAAKFACEHFHYARKYPRNTYKLGRFGVWEDGEFIGVVLYGNGAINMSKFVGLEKHECLELVRVALRSHRTPVTRIVAITFRLLRQRAPSVKVLFSYADQNQGHEGTIYVAGGWTYAGESVGASQLVGPTLETFHLRTRGTGNCPYDVVKRKLQPKHRFLYPLHRDMVDIVKQHEVPHPTYAREA